MSVRWPVTTTGEMSRLRVIRSAPMPPAIEQPILIEAEHLEAVDQPPQQPRRPLQQ